MSGHLSNFVGDFSVVSSRKEFYFFPVNKLNRKLTIPLPTFLSNPDCVVGIPVCRAKRCFAAVTPNALFHEKEKPYLDMMNYLY